MIRFILKRKLFDSGNGMDNVNYFTLDVDVPELETALDKGGYSENASDTVDLIGAEIRIRE